MSTVDSRLLPDVGAARTRPARRSATSPIPGLATALFCAARLPQPILLEGEAGVGKTEAAKALAAALDTPLIRLQCYEGIDAGEALYEWNYTRQLLAIRLAEARGDQLTDADMFTADYLVERPILAALRHPGPRPAVLLIDEIDRADDEFEAFLLEVLAEASVTIPEIGTQVAVHPPIAVLTSNRTRDLHDALKRRCLYHWIDYPSTERAAEIIRSRVPAAQQSLAEQVAAAVARIRTLDVQKQPGIAEAIGWVEALRVLGLRGAHRATAAALTLGSVVKYREDVDLVAERLGGLARRRRCLSSILRRISLLSRHASASACTRSASRPDPTAPAGSPRRSRSPALRTTDELYWLGRVTLTGSPAEIDAYDRAFDDVFRGFTDVADVARRPEPARSPIARPGRSRRDRQEPARRVTRWIAATGSRSPTATAIRTTTSPTSERERPAGAPASSAELLRSRDFADCTPAELAALRRLVAELAVVAPATGVAPASAEPFRRLDRPAGHDAHARAAPAATRSSSSGAAPPSAGGASC